MATQLDEVPELLDSSDPEPDQDQQVRRPVSNRRLLPLGSRCPRLLGTGLSQSVQEFGTGRDLISPPGKGSPVGTGTLFAQPAESRTTTEEECESEEEGFLNPATVAKRRLLLETIDDLEEMEAERQVRQSPWWSRKLVRHWLDQRQRQIDNSTSDYVVSKDDYDGMASYVEHKITPVAGWKKEPAEPAESYRRWKRDLQQEEMTEQFGPRRIRKATASNVESRTPPPAGTLGEEVREAAPKAEEGFTPLVSRPGRKRARRGTGARAPRVPATTLIPPASDPDVSSFRPSAVSGTLGEGADGMTMEVEAPDRTSRAGEEVCG